MNWQVEMNRCIRSVFAALCLLLLGWAALASRPLQAETPLDAPPPKVLYLTFDDGPSSYTEAVLDVLARHNAKATFFVLGRYAKGRSDLLHAM